MAKAINKEPELAPIVGVIITVCAVLSIWLLLGEVERNNKIEERLNAHCEKQEATLFKTDVVCQDETINYLVNGGPNG